MKQYSIKTVDGSRFDFEEDQPPERTLVDYINNGATFIGFPIDGGTKYFNVRNIVSITEKEA